MWRCRGGANEPSLVHDMTLLSGGRENPEPPLQSAVQLIHAVLRKTMSSYQVDGRRTFDRVKSCTRERMPRVVLQQATIFQAALQRCVCHAWPGPSSALLGSVGLK